MQLLLQRVIDYISQVTCSLLCCFGTLFFHWFANVVYNNKFHDIVPTKTKQQDAKLCFAWLLGLRWDSPGKGLRRGETGERDGEGG